MPPGKIEQTKVQESFWRFLVETVKAGVDGAWVSTAVLAQAYQRWLIDQQEPALWPGQVVPKATLGKLLQQWHDAGWAVQAQTRRINNVLVRGWEGLLPYLTDPKFFKVWYVDTNGRRFRWNCNGERVRVKYRGRNRVGDRA